MHERTIAHFLIGKCDAQTLNREALAAIERVDAVHERVHVAPLDQSFEVTSQMLIRICDAAIATELHPAAIRAVAFAIVTSDHLEWADELTGEILHDWSAPEINYALSPENMRRFRTWLAGSEPYPTKPARDNSPEVKVISEITRANERA